MAQLRLRSLASDGGCRASESVRSASRESGSEMLGSRSRISLRSIRATRSPHAADSDFV
jgi:hypothetical protein